MREFEGPTAVKEYSSVLVGSAILVITIILDGTDTSYCCAETREKVFVIARGAV